MNPIRQRFCNRGGFTLMEILVALAVVSTAATIFISLFGSSLTLARSTRSQTVAASLAQEQLENILRNSSKYVWKLDSAEPGHMVEVVPAGSQAQPAGVPAQPADAKAQRADAAKAQSAGAKAQPAEKGTPAGQTFDPLVVVPVEPQSSRREEAFYQKFRWQAYAALPQADSNYVHVTVVVRWKDGAKEKSVALTSSAPRFALGSDASMAYAGGKI